MVADYRVNLEKYLRANPKVVKTNEETINTQPGNYQTVKLKYRDSRWYGNWYATYFYSFTRLDTLTIKVNNFHFLGNASNYRATYNEIPFSSVNKFNILNSIFRTVDYKKVYKTSEINFGKLAYLQWIKDPGYYTKVDTVMFNYTSNPRNVWVFEKTNPELLVNWKTSELKRKHMVAFHYKDFPELSEYQRDFEFPYNKNLYLDPTWLSWYQDKPNSI